MSVRQRRDGPYNTPYQKIGNGQAWDPARQQWMTPGSDVYFPPYPWQTYFERDLTCSDELHKGPPYRSGGPFFLIRQSCPHTVVATGEFKIPNYNRYVGSFVFSKPPSLYGDWQSLSTPTAMTFGATAWNKFRPTKSKASLGQFIAELRDMPSMFRFRLKQFKDLGSNYLNYRFGWRPFVKDIIDWYETACKVDNYVARIRKNNGKWHRKGGTLRNTTETIQYNDGNRIYPVLSSYYYPGYAPTISKTTKTVTDKIWFKSVWKYYIPSLDADPAKSVFSSRLLRRLYGMEITPSLAWELLPWSWMVDWFGNVGDLMANISAASYDNLVAKYAYIMRTRRISYNTIQDQPLTIGKSLRLNGTFFVETKERAAASPYGFGLDWNGFSTSQLAILAALGISRT